MGDYRVFPASVFRHLSIVCGDSQPQHEKSGAARFIKRITIKNINQIPFIIFCWYYLKDIPYF